MHAFKICMHENARTKNAVYFSVVHDQDARRRASAHMKLWSMSSTFAAVYRVFWGRMFCAAATGGAEDAASAGREVNRRYGCVAIVSAMRAAICR